MSPWRCAFSVDCAFGGGASAKFPRSTVPAAPVRGSRPGGIPLRMVPEEFRLVVLAGCRLLSSELSAMVPFARSALRWCRDLWFVFSVENVFLAGVDSWVSSW